MVPPNLPQATAFLRNLNALDAIMYAMAIKWL